MKTKRQTKPQNSFAPALSHPPCNNIETPTEQHQWQEDFKWAVASPFLMETTITLPDIPVEITPPQAPFRGHRVGYYFESLIDHWLEQQPGVEMIAKGFQVIEEGRTIGELDFIFRDAQGEVHHWEVASKFYLYNSGAKKLGSQFIGPNAGDTFERKRDRLLSHQLPLGKKTFPEVTHSAAFVKGRIFYHPKERAPTNLPEHLNKNHLHGIWLHQSELNFLEELSADQLFSIAQKPWWLSRQQSAEELSLAALQEQFKTAQTHPILLNSRADERPIFIVPDTWPS